MPTDRELLGQIRNVPKQVKFTALLATVLGLLLCLRGILSSISSGSFSGKSLFYGVMILLFFATNGGSLLNKSRLGYVVIALFTLLPVLSSFAGALHLLVLFIKGDIAANFLKTLLSVMAALQLLLIVTLYVSLLLSPTRSYIWSSSDDNRSTKESTAIELDAE